MPPWRHGNGISPQINPAFVRGRGNRGAERCKSPNPHSAFVYRRMIAAPWRGRHRTNLARLVLLEVMRLSRDWCSYDTSATNGCGVPGSRLFLSRMQPQITARVAPAHRPSLPWSMPALIPARQITAEFDVVRCKSVFQPARLAGCRAYRCRFCGDRGAIVSIVGDYLAASSAAA